MNSRVKLRLQASLKQQSGGTLGLANLFKDYDTDRSGSLSWEEFCSALQKCGLTPSPQDIRALFLELDRDGNNQISYDEFIRVMRGEMSNARKSLIKWVFDTIDRDGDGVISMTDIGAAFNPRGHPEVRAGRSSVSALVKSFFEALGTVSDTGYLNLAQFMEYYANTAAFEDDLRFSETMKAIWSLPPAAVGAQGYTRTPPQCHRLWGRSRVRGQQPASPDLTGGQPDHGARHGCGAEPAHPPRAAQSPWCSWPGWSAAQVPHNG